VALTGYLKGTLSIPERAGYGAAAVANILFPTFSNGWLAALAAALILCAWNASVKPKVRPS
jgi:hypothetical protein